jgi:phosphatidylinositol alpha-mannosyltransferase
MSAGRAHGFRYNGSVARVAVGPQAVCSVTVWLRLGRFDVVHVHEPLVPLLGLATLLAACGERKSPLVATFHAQGDDPAWLRRVLRGLPLRHRIAASIAVSPYAAELANRRIGVVPRIIGNGIALPATGEGAAQMGSTTGEPGEPVVAFVGRFDEPRKGFSTLLQAWPSVRAAIPKARLLVAGPGTPIDVSGVEYLGVLDGPERDRLLTRATVLAAPNTGQESFGLVLVEALACATAVVASDLAEFRVTLSDTQGTAATLVPPGDATAWADAVVAALRQPPDAARGRRIATRYSWDAIGPQLLDVYHRVASASD